MMRAATWIAILFIACTGALAADPAVLALVERKTGDDLDVLRSADLPIVMEMDSCLFLRGDPAHLGWLREHGYTAKVLDSDAAQADYLVVGLRPDSDRGAVAALGTELLAEGNWVLVRVAPGATRESLYDAKVFVTPVGRDPVARPKPQPSLAPSPQKPAAELAADPLVQKMVNSVSPARISQLWIDLTSNPPTGTRRSTSQGCRDAATYCFNELQSYDVPAQYQNWSPSNAPNVIGTHVGAIDPGEVFIVIGHLDDLPTSGLAPGADDNASGSINVLESARVMSCYAFRKTVKFIACTGEEDGLLGSDAYAADAATRGEDIRGVLNMDMIGWQGNASPNPENLDLNYNQASQDLGLRFAQAATTYGTGLAVDAFSCPSLSASDHYPFWSRGWKAVCGITDNEGYCGHSGNYPYYHTSNDTIANNGNPAFFHSVVRASVATLAELAQPFKIALDRPVYSCGSGTIRIYLGDRDLNANPAAVETVVVRISSDTEAAGEDVVLTEQSPDSMIFTGTIATSGAAPVQGDGLLSVSPGDSIVAAYTDALDCDGATNVPHSVTAQTDCIAPAITGVAATGVTGNSATIVWSSDEAATSIVHFGTVPPGASTASSSALVTSHSVLVTGLTECSSYFFWVESVDAAGNSVSDDNGGAYYTFETGKNVNPSYLYSGPPVSIPDNNPAGATASVNVPDVNTIVDVDVLVNITHTFDGDLTLSLVGPDLTTVTLSSRRGSAGDNFTGTAFDDQAATTIAAGTAPFTGSFRPDSPLSAFNGKSPTGTWTLKAVDGAGTDVGTIVGFELRLAYPPQACGPSIEYLSSTKADSCNGTGSGGGNGTIEPGETVALTLTARNNGTAPVTGVTAELTTSTPGIAILDPSGAFPDLAAGASAPGAPGDFALLVDPALACGAGLELTVVFTSQEGSWTDTFSLPTGTPGQETQTYPSANVPKPIVDSSTIQSTLAVASVGTVLDVNVTMSLTHTWDSDLDIYLVGPNGTRVELTTDNGSSSDNYTSTTFDDQAATSITSGTAPFTGSFKPEGSLASLNGGPANGTWTLEITDDTSGDSATLTGWSIRLTMTSAPSCLSCAPALAGEATNLHWPGMARTCSPGTRRRARRATTSTGATRPICRGCSTRPWTRAGGCRRRLSTSGAVLGEIPAEGRVLLVSGDGGERPRGGAGGQRDERARVAELQRRVPVGRAWIPRARFDRRWGGRERGRDWLIPVRISGSFAGRAKQVRRGPGRARGAARARCKMQRRLSERPDAACDDAYQGQRESKPSPPLTARGPTPPRTRAPLVSPRWVRAHAATHRNRLLVAVHRSTV